MPTIAPALKKHTCSTALLRAPADGADASITISTIDRDRDGDIVVPDGMRTPREYFLNPVVLAMHDHYSLPIGRTVNLTVVPGKSIRADFNWLKNDPVADRFRNAFDQGVLSGASIGFQPHQWEPLDGGGYKFTDWTLLEWSLVPLPANAHAVRALKSLGLDAPLPVVRAALSLDQLRAELKSGRVLSARNEDRLRQASTLISDVLAQLDDAPEDDSKTAAVLVDGELMTLSDDTIRQAVTKFVDGEIARVTGRLPDDEPVLFTSDDADQPVIQVSDEELVALVGDAMREALNSFLGRVN